MILFANGCSWTAGGALEPYYNTDQERLELIWPHHLGTMLQAEKVVNLAAGCGSNQRILRTTLNWVLRQPAEVLKNTLAIIQWTEYSRYEYYNPLDHNNLYENISDRWAKAKIDCVMDPFTDDVEYSRKRSEKRLETYTEIEGLYNLIFSCAALHEIFQRYNIKYYYWQISIPEKNQPPLLQNLLEQYNWIDDPQKYNYDRVSKTDAHPSVTGNKQLAEIFFNDLKNRKEI